MGFYLKKSISVGPFRFNLSNSGIGISAGVRGFRVGTGPRGNYVHMGIGGLYYRKTLPATIDTNNKIVNNTNLNTQNINSNLTEIESDSVDKMFDSSSLELVTEINEKQKLLRFAPISIGVGLMFALAVLSSFGFNVAFLLVCTLTAAMAYILSIKDDLRKSTVIFYDFEPETEKLYQQLHDSFSKITSCSAKWHVEAEGGISDTKRNAGATKAIRRTAIELTVKNPPFVKTNILTPSIPVGKQTLYFFPDKVLVFENNKVGAVSYSNLNINVQQTRFVEEDTVPKDAAIIDKTWKFVNKKGGPDRRFNNNRELPIALYEEIDFTSQTGLNERIQISKVNTATFFKETVGTLGVSLPK